MKAFTETMSSGKLTPKDDLQVTQRGSIVWTTVTFHLSAKPKAGAPMEIDCRHTAIWEKRGAHWLIVHEHLSAPLPE
jgi:ketosteroid isomerase-like protein